MNISLFRYAFVLILLSLIGGLFIPILALPRLGLSAHTIGAISGILLIAIGTIWQHFQLPPRLAKWLAWSWLYSSYMNWFACILSAALGAGNMTPIAAAGNVGTNTVESLTTALFVSVAIASFSAVGLSLWGLRKTQ